MLRATPSRLLPIAATSVPSNFTSAIEMAFYYPRFQPITHVADMGIPQIKDAVALLQGPESTLAGYTQSKHDDTVFYEQKRWSTSAARPGAKFEAPEQREARLKKRDKGLMQLECGIEILENIGGPSAQTPGVASMVRSLYATRFELLNGSEHLPRPEYAKRVHVQKLILRQSARLLYYNDAWDKSDVQQIDTSLVILGHFVKAFCALNMKPFNDGPSATAAAASATAAATAGAATSSPSSGGGGTIGLKSSSASRKAKQAASSGAEAPETSSSPSAGSTTPGAAGTRNAKKLFNGKDWFINVLDGRVGNGAGNAGTEGILTLQMVMDRIDEALRLAVEANKRHGANAPDLRWHEPKLLLLKGLLTIPLTGNLAIARRHMNRASQIVVAMKERKNPLLDGLNDREFEMELGLYNLCLAEMSVRMFDWVLPEGHMDAALMRDFEAAAQFYASPFDTVLDGDGIMSEKAAHERVFEIEAYCCCLLSYAGFLLNAPRPRGTSTRDTPVFLPRQIFNFNPLFTVAGSSDMIFADVTEKVKLTIEDCRKRTGKALMRGLEINRAILPECKENPMAAWTLAGMACMYADTRDYLYATGLFESAHKAFVFNYGTASMENVLLQRLRYEFMAGVGSEQEAKTASHEIVALLKQMDKRPSE